MGVEVWLGKRFELTMTQILTKIYCESVRLRVVKLAQTGPESEADLVQNRKFKGFLRGIWGKITGVKMSSETVRRSF